MPHPAGAVVGRPQPTPRRLARLASRAAAAGPLPARPRLQVQRPELIHAKDHLRVARPGGRLAVTDRVQVIHPRLLGRVVRVGGGLPGLHGLKRDVLRAQQLPQALMGDIVDHPLGDQEVSELGQAPPGKRQPVLGRPGLGDLLDLPPLGQREHRRAPARIPRIQRLQAVGAEAVQHVADPVLAGKSQLRDLRHAHALRRPQHHLRPPPRHHRPAAAAHDPFQAIALIIADLTHSHPASHTRQCGPGQPLEGTPAKRLVRRKKGKRRPATALATLFLTLLLGRIGLVVIAVVAALVLVWARPRNKPSSPGPDKGRREEGSAATPAPPGTSGPTS